MARRSGLAHCQSVCHIDRRAFSPLRDLRSSSPVGHETSASFASMASAAYLMHGMSIGRLLFLDVPCVRRSAVLLLVVLQASLCCRFRGCAIMLD